MNLKKNKFIEILLFLSFFILIFQEVIQDKISILKYYDEFLVIVNIYVILVYFAKYRYLNLLNKQDVNIIILLIILCILGIFYNILSDINVALFDILLDMLGIIKVYVIFFGTIILLKNVNESRLIRYINIFSRVYVVIALACGVLNILSIIDMSYDVRYGIKSFEFIYTNPGTLNNICIAFLALFTLQKDKNIIYIIITLLTMCLTLRGKALAIAGLYIVLVWILKEGKKTSILKILIMVLVLIVLGYNQLYEYYLTGDETQRSILLKYGIETANEYFPLGAGFGTYGSDVANKNYSELYNRYNFNSYYGMTKDNPQFLNDNFWPMLMGQFGWIGVFIYVLILYQLYKAIRTKINNKKDNLLGALTIFFSIVVSTLAAAILTSYLGVILMFTLAFLLNNESSIKKENDN